MLQPENAIILPKWKPGSKEPGGGGDTGLVGLIPFLESIAILNVPDVRPVVEKYKGKDIAVEYAKVSALYPIFYFSRGGLNWPNSLHLPLLHVLRQILVACTGSRS